MKLEAIREAIDSIKYKPGSSVELAQDAKESGALGLVIRLTIVDADSKIVSSKIHTYEIPPAAYIKDIDDLARHVRLALQTVENYESDQWLQIDGLFPYRRAGGKDWTRLIMARHN